MNFTAKTSIFDALSEFLGVPSLALEGGAVVLLIIVILKLLQILFLKEKEDVKQLDLSSQLAILVARGMEGTDALKLAIQQNTGVLAELKGAIEGIVLGIRTQFTPIKDSVDQVRQELLSNKKTRVVVKDKDGNTIAEVTAEPEIDENGEQYLVVQYNLRKEPQDAESGPSTSVS